MTIGPKCMFCLTVASAFSVAAGPKIGPWIADLAVSLTGLALGDFGLRMLICLVG